MTADKTMGGEAIPAARRAPHGMIWQCQACGKKAVDQYGLIGWHSYGWDESCMLNAAAVPGSPPLPNKDKSHEG